jgi:hypothetical protein
MLDGEYAVAGAQGGLEARGPPERQALPSRRHAVAMAAGAHLEGVGARLLALGLPVPGIRGAVAWPVS